MIPNSARFVAGPLLAATVGASPAIAAPALAPDAYVPVLKTYVEHLAETRTQVAACLGAGVLPAEPKQWAEAKAVLVASFWANDMPEPFVADAIIQLEAQRTAGGKCKDPVIRGQVGRVTDTGWVQLVTYALEGLGFTVVAAPPTAEQWSEVRAAFDEDVPQQARMIQCAAEIDPLNLPMIVGDWNSMLIGIGQQLISAGFARPNVVALLDSSDTNTIWKPAAAADRPALYAACLDETGWQDRFATFEFGALKSKVEAIVAPAATQ